LPAGRRGRGARHFARRGQTALGITSLLNN